VAELGLQDRKDLPQLGRRGAAVDQKAPGFPIDGTGPDGGTQRGRDESFNRLQPLTRFTRQLREPGQSGRRIGGFVQGHGGLQASVHDKYKWARRRGDTVHFIITDAWLAKSRAIHLSGTKLVVALFTLSLALMLLAAGLYHWVFLKGAREGWPVIGTLVKLIVKDEFEQRDRFMRENLDAMARKLVEMQA
jgi:hypothetical protein